VLPTTDTHLCGLFRSSAAPDGQLWVEPTLATLAFAVADQELACRQAGIDPTHRPYFPQTVRAVMIAKFQSCARPLSEAKRDKQTR